MKKLLLGVSAVAALWLGATAYISSSIKGEMEGYIQRVNALYEPNGMHISADIHSGFFTSDMTLKVDLDKTRLGAAATQMYAKFLALPVKMDYKITHGPIFINGFGLGVAKMTGELKLSTLLTEENKQAFLKVIPDDLILTSDEVVCFDKTIHSTFKTNALKVSENGESIAIEPLEGTSTIDSRTLLGHMDFKFPLITVQSKEANVTIKDITFKGQMDDMLNGRYYLGNFTMDTAQIKASGGALPTPLTYGLHMNMQAKRAAEGRLNLGIEVASNLVEGAKQLGVPTDAITISFSAGFEALSIKLLDLLEEVNRAQVKLLDASYAVAQDVNGTNQTAAMDKITAATQSLMDTLQEAGKEFLKEKTKFYAGVHLTTDNKEQSSAAVKVGYAGKPVDTLTLEELANYLGTQPLEYLVLDTNMSLNEKHLDLLPPENKEQTKQSLQLAAMQGGVKMENGNYVASLQYQPKTLKINGEDKTQEVLPLLELMLAAQNAAMQQQPSRYAIPAEENVSMEQNDKNASMDQEEDASSEDANESM